jgi:flagellar biosynthesis protein FlhB
VAEESFQEKTEEATGKRRTDARNKGQVARSMDLNSSFMILFGLLLLLVCGGGIISGLAESLRAFMMRAGTFAPNADSLRMITAEAATRFAMILGPVVGGMAMIGLGAGYAQVGALWTLEPLKPNFAKLNPLTGIKKVVISRRAAVEIAKNVMKASVVGYIAYLALESVLSDTVSLMDGDPMEILGFMARASLGVGFKTGIAFLGLSVLDFFYQRFEHEKNLKMSKEEVKEEMKETEGDPHTKARIRGIQRKIAYKRMMAEVPKADVVLTNPTHLAVALKYESKKMGAPRVVAKGAGLIAERIKEIARANNVPVVEDKPLARALYKSVDVGDEIPEKLFQAVAQVLAYIYRLRTSRARHSLN